MHISFSVLENVPPQLPASGLRQARGRVWVNYVSRFEEKHPLECSITQKLGASTLNIHLQVTSRKLSQFNFELQCHQSRFTPFNNLDFFSRNLCLKLVEVERRKVKNYSEL